ncbi:MAG: TIGR01244 family sulfur transferase [Pseudomonadota bacterium]
MSRFLPLTDDFAVSPQISADDVRAAAEQGYQHIICNRPDGEDDGQPDFAEISKVAVSLGMSAHHIPFDNTTLSGAVIDTMQNTLGSLDGPVLAYCRSGTRCSIAWSALQRRDGQSFEAIESATGAAGYALANQRDLIDAIAQ